MNSNKSKMRCKRGFTLIEQVIAVVKQSCHPEFISGSTPLVAIQNKEEMLKPFNETPYYNLTGLGPKVMASVQHDNRRRGFTLIELLIVVLIIGILAAVAVPQYKRAVLKTKWTFVKAFMEEVLNQQHLYLLENGSYAVDLKNLPAFETWKKQIEGQYLSKNGEYQCLNKNYKGMEFVCYYLKNRKKVRLVVFFNNPDKVGMCRYGSDEPQEKEVCLMVGATCSSNSADCTLIF